MVNRSRLLTTAPLPPGHALWAALLPALILGSGSLLAQGRTLWQERGVQLCGSSADQTPIAATSDSTGGAMVVWPDSRRGGYYGDIYAQRVDASGVPQWTANGVLLRDSIAAIGDLQVVDDGKHGAIAVWSDMGGTPWLNQVTAQRVSANGISLWGRHGVTLRDANDDIGYFPALVGDGHGGAIVALAITPSAGGVLDTLLVQRVDSSGSIDWETLVRADTLDWFPVVCADGSGGVLVAWYQWDSDRWAVRVQHVDSAGAPKWDSGGVLVCSLRTWQTPEACVPLGDSCFAVGVRSLEMDTVWRLRVQALGHTGRLLWEPSGVPVGAPRGPSSRAVGLLGGAPRQTVWLWNERRSGTYDLFAQCLDSCGFRRWDTLGVHVATTATGEGRAFHAVGDGRGGMILSWVVFRTQRNSDIYSQRLDMNGLKCWSDTGLAVCLDTDQQRWSPATLTDGVGGAILAWQDLRWASGPGTYAQRVADAVGCDEKLQGHSSRNPISIDPARGNITLCWPACLGRSVAIFDASGRRVVSLPGSLSGAGEMRAHWNGRDSRGNKCPTGAYIVAPLGRVVGYTRKVMLISDRRSQCATKRRNR